MNLKKFYDAASAAETDVQRIAEQINEHFDNGENGKALELRPSLDKAKADAKNAHELYISMQASTEGALDPAARFVPTNGDTETKEVKELRASNEYTRMFFDAFKAGVSPKTLQAGMHRSDQFPLLVNALTEAGGSPAGSEGGFLLPIDFDNMIIEKMRAYIDLALSVNTEEVTAYSGWRAIETAAAALPFAAIVVANGLAETENPTFSKVDYTLVDYGGYLPVSNGLLQDTPVNIMQYLSSWFARKAVLTNNSLILALVNALSPVTVTDYKTIFSKIKTVLNKALDPAISAASSVFCNQSGFDLLDQLEDGTGKPLLQPDPSNEIVKRLKGRPVVVVPSSNWADTNSNTKTRIAIGDGREFCTLFRRSAFEMAATSIGGDAWRKNNTEIRGIMRADVTSVDPDAMVLLSVTLPA